MKEKLSVFEYQSDALFDIWENASDKIVVLDKRKRIVFINNRFETYYGINQVDAVGKYKEEVIAVDSWKFSIVSEVLKYKKTCHITRDIYDGVKVIVSGVPILNQQKELTYIVISISTKSAHDELAHLQKNAIVSNEEGHIVSRMISHNDEMNVVYDICRKVAKTDSTLLIYGETGTGKSLLANYIHESSNRKHQPLVQINCATVPEELFESELFGYVKGAFTGASDSGKTGLIESADGGTLFLDEIGTISLEAQAKLLQVLQDRSFMPIGSNVKKNVDIRIIAATNEDLLQLVERRAFREDLYYRLNVVDVILPPLRERREDIILFIDAFLKEFNEIHQKNVIITKECLDILLHFSWPGNIRQLRNVLERLVILCDTTITKNDLPNIITKQLDEIPLVFGAKTLQEALNNTTRLVVRQSFLTYQTSRRVANDIGVSQSTAVRLIQEHCQDLIHKHKQSNVE